MTYVNRVAVTVDTPGHIAIAYVGSLGGISGTFNGYIAESNDALGEDPTFVGASVNDPLHPLMSSAYANAETSNKGRILVADHRIWPRRDAVGGIPLRKHDGRGDDGHDYV